MSGRVLALDPAAARRLLRGYLGALVGVCLLLGLLHVLYADVSVGGTPWFDLDKERNAPTWFSGLLFFLIGIAAVVAFLQEKRQNRDAEAGFRLPILWLGVAAVAVWMSLDEITILHENLFWREVRLASNARSDAWKYVTQWQIVFGPAIALALGYMALFFANRFAASPAARRGAFVGLAAWVVALALEGVRGSFREVGSGWYDAQVVVEELLEMLGAVFLLGAVARYAVEVALESTRERRPALGERLLTGRGLAALAASVGALGLAAVLILFSARRQAELGAPVPELFRRAVAEAAEAPAQPVEPQALRPPDLPPGPAPAVWFDDVAAGQPLPTLDDDGWVAWLGSLLGDDLAPPAVRAAVAADRAPRIALVSIGGSAGAARVVHGFGRGIDEAVRRALAAGGIEPGPLANRWIKIDLVDRVDAQDRIDFRPPLAMEPGLSGLAFERRAAIAILPEQIQANHLIDGDRAIRPRAMLEWMQSTDSAMAERFTAMFQPGVLNPYRFFTTRGFFLAEDRFVPLYRGHRTFEPSDPALLLHAARMGGNYLVSVTDEQGRFDYSFKPSTGEVDEGYNMLRHAGTIYSMVELYEATGDEAVIDAARRALTFLRQNTHDCPKAVPETQCVIDGDSVKLGGNALGAIAIARYTAATGDPAFRDLLAPLARWMQSVQGEAGMFTVHKQRWPDGLVSDFVSAYYPGEAILALVRVYDEIDDPSLLDTAAAAARWLITVRDKGTAIGELSHDHWLLYGLNELYRHRPDPIFLEHARKIVQAIVDSQNRDPEFPDWRGSYQRPPRSTPTAIRSEGLAAARALLRDFGKPGEADPVLDAIRHGVAFQLQTQHRPETVMYYAEPLRTLGAFQESLTDDEVRIDYTQHNVSALLALRRILLEQKP